MTVPGFDRFARRAAAAITRRAALLTLGTALAAAPARPAPAASGRRGKQSKKRCQKKIATMCDTFEADCRQMVAAYCNFQFPSQPQLALQCEDNLRPCCTALLSCDVRSNLECVLGKFV